MSTCLTPHHSGALVTWRESRSLVFLVTCGLLRLQLLRDCLTGSFCTSIDPERGHSGHPQMKSCYRCGVLPRSILCCQVCLDPDQWGQLPLSGQMSHCQTRLGLAVTPGGGGGLGPSSRSSLSLPAVKVVIEGDRLVCSVQGTSGVSQRVGPAQRYLHIQEGE